MAIVQQLDKSTSSNVLSVAGWACMPCSLGGAQAGHTSWQLFNSVMSSIDRAIETFPGLDLRKSVVLVRDGLPVELMILRPLASKYEQAARGRPDQLVPTECGRVALKDLFPTKREVPMECADEVAGAIESTSSTRAPKHILACGLRVGPCIQIEK